MKKFAFAAVVVATSFVGAVLAQTPEKPKSQDAGATAKPSAETKQTPDESKKPAEQPAMPPMPPPPGEHHKWLEQLIGTWTFESNMSMEGMPPIKSTGTDTVRSLDGRWVLCELKSEMPGMGTMSAMLTLGHNPETGKYQGTWVDSVTDHMWVYVGTLDSTRKILTLEAEGPNMMDPTKGNTKYRDVIEFKSADHRTLTSSALVDGKWQQFMTADYRKRK
jgi:hypothetical protein